MRSRAARKQRLICNRGLIKHPRLGSGAHVRHPEARSSRSPKRPRLTKLEPAQAVADSMLSHDRGDESPDRSIVYPFCGFLFAHATSFLFHSSALSPCVSTPQPQSRACLSVPHRTLEPPRRPKRRQVISRSTLQPRSEKAAMYCMRGSKKEPHDASSSLADEPGLGS
jgi:hypothetical protein